MLLNHEWKALSLTRNEHLNMKQQTFTFLWKTSEEGKEKQNVQQVSRSSSKVLNSSRIVLKLSLSAFRAYSAERKCEGNFVCVKAKPTEQGGKVLPKLIRCLMSFGTYVDRLLGNDKN